MKRPEPEPLLDTAGSKSGDAGHVGASLALATYAWERFVNAWLPVMLPASVLARSSVSFLWQQPSGPGSHAE